MAKAIVPFRQIHLDFHTGPSIPDVGRDFDAKAFARTLKKAHVDSVTVFAKCHHGHLYYTTKRPERHPGLRKGLDLTASQVEALHREGIRAPIYISVQCDEYAADTHPEWIATKPDSSYHMWRGNATSGAWFGAGWQILDMSSPYQDYLAEQTREILTRFKPVDGIFFDMCWDQQSCSQWAIAGMDKAGLNPESEDDRKTYANQVTMAYMKRFHALVRAAAPKAGVYFNGRPLANLPREVRYQEQVEIEALPTGGWGYMYFPSYVRFARNFGKDYLGMTARFHKSWADFGGLKPYAALEYETSQMMAHGARCSIGDQLHPRGILDRGAYELIGKAYARVAEREPWLDGARSVAQIGLFQIPNTHNSSIGLSGSDEGAVRLLTQLKHQFDVVDFGSDLERYELLVLPDRIPVDKASARRLRTYLDRGGRLLVSGESGLDATQTATTLAALPIKPLGMSPFSSTYVRFGESVAAGVAPSDHIMYDRSVRVVPARGGKTVAGVVEPYFERGWRHFSSHAQTPGDKLSRYAAAVLSRQVAYIAYPVFAGFAAHGNLHLRQLVGNLIDKLLPAPLLRLRAPSSTEATVMRQRGRTIVHLLQYCPERRAENRDIVEDIVPLRDVAMSLRLERQPRKAYLAPELAPLQITWRRGRAEVVVPEVTGHAMVVFE